MLLIPQLLSVCKEIQALALRRELRDLVLNLNLCKTGSPTDRSSFGYYARHLHRQFFGFLDLDRRRTKLAQGKYPILLPPIEDKERELLSHGHRLLASIVSCCLRRSIMEPLNDYIDPYFGQSLKIVESWENQLPSLPSLYDCVAKTKPAVLLRREVSRVKPDLFGKQFLQGISAIQTRLNKQGVHDTPEDIIEVTLSSGSHVFQGTVYPVMIGVLCMREVITNIIQILYQATIRDKPIILNENNVYGIEKHNAHLSGEGLTLDMQPSTFEERFGTPGDIVRIRLPYIDKW